MTSISSGSGPVAGPLGEATGTSTTVVDRPAESAPVSGRDGAGDAAALARTEAARAEAPGSGMSEGPRLELQQWTGRLSDLSREFEALPPGSAEANARLAEIRQHLTRLAALQSRVEEGLRSGPAALAQDYLLLLSSSRGALTFLNAHRSDPGSEAFGAEATLIGELQSRRDRSLASLRTLAAERLLPSLNVAEGAEPSEQQVGDYRLLLRINGVLGEAELETVPLSRDLTTAYAAYTHPDTVAAGGELPAYLSSSLFRELDPNPPRTGEAPAAHSPDAAFPEGHPMRDLYRTLWEHRGEAFSEADARRLIQQLQGLRGELGDGGRYANFVSGSNRGNLTASLENLERLLRDDPRRVSEDDVLNMERPLRLLGTLEYQAQLQSSAGTTTRGRIGLYWRLYEEYRRLGNGEAARGCLYNIYQTSQMNLLPENRTNGLSEADRQAVLVRFLEAYVGTGRLDVNFASMMNSLDREIRHLWERGTEESRFTALSLWTRYNGLHRWIEANYTEGTMNFLLLAPPHRLFGTTAEALPALLRDMETRARASEDPNAGAARLIAVAQAYASNGDMATCTAILRGVEGSVAAHPANEGNPFASRALILGAFSNADMSELLGDYVDGWIASDREALREARPRDRAQLLSETLQDWASLMSGLAEIGRPEMASRVFAALDAEMAPLTPESRARVYREILPHMHGAQREEILDRVRDLIGSDAERSERLSIDARVQLNAIVGEFSSNPFEIQGALTALTSIVRYERPSPEVLVEIHRYRLALRNHIHDLVRAHPDRLVEGSEIREMWLWVDGYGGRDGGSNAIVDDLTSARRTLLDRLSGVTNPGERRRILTLLGDSFREGMRMRLHGNDYGLRAFVDQHLEMIRSLRPAERPSVFAQSLQFLNQLEVERMRARGREVDSFRNVYYDTMTAALPSLIADIPAGPERRSAILQFTRALSQAREAEERRLRTAERSLAAVRATSAYHWAIEHGFDSRFIGRTEAENVDSLRPAVEAMHRMETDLWNQFAEGEPIPEAHRVYEGFARAMSLTVEGRSGEARAAMTAYFSDPEVQAFLRSDPAGDAHRAEAQAQIQQLLEVSATILNGEAGARFDRTLRIVRGLARIRLHTLRAEGQEYPYDIGTIDRMTRDLPRFLATLPPDRMPQTFEAALQLFGAANEGNARLVREYNGAINRIPVQRVGEDGAARTGSVWGLIRAMEHIGDPGGAERAFTALRQVVADDTDWDLLSREGRGDLGPALQDFCDIILEEGTNVSPELRQSVANFRARIPEEEEWGHFLRQTFNWQLAVDIGLMAISGGVGGMARAAVSRLVIGLAERAALRMVSTTAIRMTMMTGRGLAYVGGHLASGVTFNLIHASTSALILNRPMENPFASGLRMSADSIINDPISMMLFNSIPGPSSMVGRFLYRQVATAITFQISQNIRYHAERGARELLDSDFHRAVERREHMRAMWEATGDSYYQERLEAAESRVTEIIGHEPDNSVRGIMLNIGMNIGQAGADHVMGTHHWAGHFGLEGAPHAAAERPGAPRTEAERAAHREHHLSLADALADARAARLGSGREAPGGPYRGGAEEAPAREAAARRAGEERAFFRELVDLDVYGQYAPEALGEIVDHVARRFDPHGEPPALNEPARRFLRFFFTHVNPEHAGRVPPEALPTLLEAAVSGTRPAERARVAEESVERREAGTETPAAELPTERIPGLERRGGEVPLAERALRASPDLEATIRDREVSPEAELGLRLLADEGLGDTMAHLDDLLRHADPETLRTPEGRERFLRGYREAHAHLEANPDALGGRRPHEALAALMGRRSSEDLPTAARRLVAGEIRLRPRTAAEHGLLPPGVHAESPLRRLVAEELTSRHQESSLRETARAVEHARREVRELTALLRARENDPRFAAIDAQTRDIRVRLEAAQRRVVEVRGRIRELRRAERELSRRGLDPQRRRELSAEANRLRRDIAQRIAGIRNAEAGVTRFVAMVRALEHATPRPDTESAPEGIRVEVSETGPERTHGTATEALRRGAEGGPEIQIVDEGIRVDLSEASAAAEIRADTSEEVPPHLVDPSRSATGTAARMSSGVLAVLGLGTLGLATLAPNTAHAQDAAVSGGHGLIADSAHFLSNFLHLSPLAMTGTAATIALGFGAVYAIFRRAARARAVERTPAGVRESAADRGRAGEASRGDADGGGGGRQQGDSHREDGAGPELPARMAPSPDIALATPEAHHVPAVETSFEGVLQDNAPGAPRRGAIAVREPSPDYGTASGATHEGLGYKDSNEDALVHGVDATGARYAVVLDGMGGMGRGDQASRLAGEVIQAEMSAHGDMMRAFEAAHEAVRRRYPGAGACAVAHRVFRGADGRMRMEIVHVGDSGAAVFDREGRVIYRTRDQSQVQMLADAGLIEGGELAMRTHPDVNVVLGGLGPSQSPPPVRHELVLEGGERAVMFSDGLGDNASTEEMARRVLGSSGPEEVQQALIGLALQRMGILDSLYEQFDTLPDGARIPFTAPDGRTLYLARDLPVSQLQGGEVEMINVYDAAEGGTLVDHYKPDNVAVHVYFHNPLEAVAGPSAESAIRNATAEAYIPTQVPADGAPQPVDLPPAPPRLGLAADPTEARTVELLNRLRAPVLRAPARPGEPYHLHFPDFAGLIPVGTEAITGPTAIVDPAVAPRHAVIERVGPQELLVQNLDENQTFIVMPDGSHYPVGMYGAIIRNGQEIVMGGTRLRVTAEGRAPTQEEGSPFGPHPFRGAQHFYPDFATGPKQDYGVRILPEPGWTRERGGGYAVESIADSAPISVRENPADPGSPWRALAPGERHPLRFAHGVSEEYRNADGRVYRMTRRGEIIHVRGGEFAPEFEAPGAPPIELALGERERFAIGTRPESDVALPPYGIVEGRVLLDPYLHVPSSPDPNLRYAPDVPADHAEIFRTPEGEWRIRNLSGAVMEIPGTGGNHFFLPRGAEMSLTEGQEIIFRGERPYRYRFRIPRSETPGAPELHLPRPEVGRRTSAWMDAPNAEALTRRLAEEGLPFHVRAETGPSDPEGILRGLAETPPSLALRFENGRLSPDSVELLFAFAAMPVSLRERLQASARVLDAMFTDLTLSENPLAHHYMREAAALFHYRVFRQGLPELAQSLARLRPENAAETEAALARLFFWGPENLALESNLQITGITGDDRFYMLNDAHPSEFPDPAERARVQARIEAAREDGRRAQAEAELIRERFRQHFAALPAMPAPPLNRAGLRGLVAEMVRNVREVRGREAAPAAEPRPPSPPRDATIGDAPRVGRARFRPITEIAAEAERVSGGLRRGESPDSERVSTRVARYRDHLIEQGVESGEAQARAEAWRDRVLGAARARQAAVTHIYDTSLPVRAETAHLDAATVDHHGRFANERNATEQLLDRFAAALESVRADSEALEAARADREAMAAALEGTGRAPEAATAEDVHVAAALRALNLREVTTDNLADGGWSVWIARNQSRILRDPQLRALIESATHFEDFSAFGTTYAEAEPGVRLQAALFQGYGEILRRHGIRGSDRFSPLQAPEVMGEAMALIDGLVVDPARREAQAAEFFSQVERARAIAAERAVIAEASVREGDTRLTFFDLRALSDFTVFQQWLALPRVTGPDGAPHSLQVSVAPMPPARTAAGAEAPRTLQIVAIPHGRALPSGRGLLSALERVNAAERARALELGVEPANAWFGKDNVILPNPAGGGTLLHPAELSAILRDPALALFEPAERARPRPEASVEISIEQAQDVAVAPRAEPRAEPPAPPRPPAAAGEPESPVLEARRHGRQAFRALGDVLSAYSVRRSPELTAALQNIRETLRAGDARELQTRLERARDIFSDPQLRTLWEFAETLSRGEARGASARDLLLAVLDGRVLDADQARTFLRSAVPALRLERRMREVARDLGEALRGAGLGELAEERTLAERALRPLLRRLFHDPAHPPSDAQLSRELLTLRDTLNTLRRELERQPGLTPELRRQLLDGYLGELAAGTMTPEEALRRVEAGNAAMRRPAATPAAEPSAPTAPPRPAEADPALRSAVDRLVLLAGDRSAQARERWLTWALSGRHSAEALHEIFWETLAGTRRLGMEEGVPTVDERRGSPDGLAAAGERIHQTLDALGVPSRSRAGVEIATLLLARAAVEASPGAPQFSHIRLQEQATAAEALVEPLRAIVRGVPDLSAGERGALTVWALRNGLTAEALNGFGRALRGQAGDAAASPGEILRWVLRANPGVETVSRIANGEYRFRRGAGSLELLSPDGRPVNTGFEAQLRDLRENFARNFQEASPEPSPRPEAEQEFFDDWGGLGDEVRADLDARVPGEAGATWPRLDDVLASRLAPDVAAGLRGLLEDFRPPETAAAGEVLDPSAVSPARRMLESYAQRGPQEGPLGEMARELNMALGNELQPGQLRRLLETLRTAPETSPEFANARREVEGILDLARRFAALRTAVSDRLSHQQRVYAALVSRFVAGRREGHRRGILAVESGLAVGQHQDPVFVDTEGNPVSADDPGALTQVGRIAERLQRGEPVDLDAVHVTLASAEDMPPLLLALRQLCPGLRAESGSLAEERIVLRYEPAPGTTLRLRIETMAAQRNVAATARAAEPRPARRAAAELPPAVQDFLRENFSHAEPRAERSAATLAGLPVVRDALTAAEVPIDGPEGRWIAERLLIDVARGRVDVSGGPALREGELSVAALRDRVRTERGLYRAVEALGFEATSHEGRRLAEFLQRQVIREARDVADAEARLARTSSSGLREASDRLVLLGEERSAAARVRHLEWAIASDQTPESLQEIFWNALRGRVELRLTPNGVEAVPRDAEPGALAETGERVAEILDGLHVPAFSVAGTRLATEILAQAAVEARAGGPRFGSLRLGEVAARIDALRGSLQPVLSRMPAPTASARAELFRWALRTGQNAESLGQLDATLALLPQARAEALLRWAVESGQHPEGLRALRETVEACLDMETPVTTIEGIRRVHAARLEEARIRQTEGPPRVSRGSPGFATLERFAFLQGDHSNLFEADPDAAPPFVRRLSLGGARRARLWNFADPHLPPGPLVNLARRAERALGTVYERSVEIESLARSGRDAARLAEARTELEAAQREIESWEDAQMHVLEAAPHGERIADRQSSVYFNLRRAIEPDIQTFDATHRPLPHNPVQALANRILEIDGARPDFFELADAWLDPDRGNQGDRPIEAGRLTVVVNRPGDVASVAEALERVVRDSGAYADPEIRIIAEDGVTRLECRDRADRSAFQLIRVLDARRARAERGAEELRAATLRRHAPAAAPLPELRAVAPPEATEAPVREERRTQPARPGNVAPPAAEVAASMESTQAETPSGRAAARDAEAPSPPAPRSGLRVLRGQAENRPSLDPPAPALPLAAGAETSSTFEVPTALDPLAVLGNPERRDAFLDSLSSLEAEGLIPPGLSLEDYRLPGTLRRSDDPSRPAGLHLRPGGDDASRFPYRIESVGSGVLTLRRLGEGRDGGLPDALEFAVGHGVVPFHANDYVFLHEGGGRRGPEPRHPDAPPDSGGPDLPARHAIHPEVLAETTVDFAIPPSPLPDFDYTAGRAELELSLVDQGPHVWLGTTLESLDAMAADLEAHASGLFQEYGPVAADLRADLAVLRDPAAPLEALESAVGRLGEVLRLRREFPANDSTLNNFFRDRVLDFYRRDATPPAAAPDVGTLRPPRPGTAETAARDEGAAETPLEPHHAELLGEIEALAARNLEGFSDLARRTRETLAAHDATRADASDPAGARAWAEERRRILESYRAELRNTAADLVARHEGPGRRVLEFLQGLSQDEALWESLEARGVDRARLAADIPPHGRPKAVDDVLPKIERRGWNSLQPFTDLFGTRIVVESYHDAVSVLAAVRSRFEVRPEYSGEGRPIFPTHRRSRGRDGVERVRLNMLEGNRPLPDQERIGRVLDGRRSGYRALHVVVEVDGHPVEIQIQTRALYRWGQIQHDFYKNETLARPENRDIRETVDRYFAETARYLARTEQGVRAERPPPPELPAERLETLPRETRDEIQAAIRRAEALISEHPPVETRSAAVEEPRAAGVDESMALAASGERMEGPAEPAHGEETPAVPATRATGRRGDADPFDGGNGLHASFLGAGLMMAMTSLGHAPQTSLLAGILGTILPIGLLGVIRWVRGRPSNAPATDTVSAAADTEGAARAPREAPPLEAAPPPEPAPPPDPSERPLLQPNLVGGNLAEIDAHLAGETLDPARMAEVLARHSRRVTLPGGEVVYLATQGIDPKHPVGEDFMGGVEYRDPLGRRVYSMMVADGMGGMGHGDAAAQLSVTAFTYELRRSGDIRSAWNLANAAVREFNRAIAEGASRENALRDARSLIQYARELSPEPGRDGAGACSVSFSVIAPSRPAAPYVLQSHFAGDASLRVYRRGPDGRYRRIYATVEENFGAMAADSLQESGEALRRTREIRLHPMSNRVTNGVGANESLHLSDTARGEIPQPNGHVRRAEGYEHGLVLQEGDLVLAGSDGFWENFIDTDIVGELVQGAQSAEQAHRVLREETHARMEVVRRVRDRQLPAAGNGRFRFTHRGRELFIDRQYNVYESETATSPVDKYKPDNFSLAAYLHRPSVQTAASGPPPRPATARADAPQRRVPSVPPPIPAAARRQRPAATADPVLARAQETGLRLAGHLEGLTPELENRFLSGLRVTAVEQPTLHYLSESTGHQEPASAEQYRLYSHWRERMAMGTGGLPAALAEIARLPARPAAAEILADPRSAPIRRIQVGEFGMYLSRVIQVNDPHDGSRDYVLAVVPELRDGVMTLRRRFFYRSNSGGGWRASPFYGLGGLQKGQPRFEHDGNIRGKIRILGARHYTAESEPLPEVIEALESIDRGETRAEMSTVEIDRLISLDAVEATPQDGRRAAARMSMLHGYGERTHYVESLPISHLQTEALQPGRVFEGLPDPRRAERVIATLRDLEYPLGFLPNFTAEPLRTYRARHVLLGEVTYREYGGSRLRALGGRERDLIWTVAEDGTREDGSTRVWIQSIRFADARPTSYGVPDQVLDSGILTSKPVEYASQAEILEGSRYVAPLPNDPGMPDGEPRYVDITPALDALAPIRAYRRARGLPVAESGPRAPAPAPARRPPSVPPPIPAAARRRPAATPAVQIPRPDAAAGPSAALVIAGGEHLYRIQRGGARLGDRRHVYQLRLDSEAGPQAPLFQEIESPRPLSPQEIEAALDGRLPAGVEVREGWHIVDFRGSGPGSPLVQRGALPLALLPNTPGMQSVQLDFYVLPDDTAPLETASTNPRVSLVDPALRGASGRHPVLNLTGRSESGDPARRDWVLSVPQDREPVLVNGQEVLPFDGFVRLVEGDRVHIGLNEFSFRGQSLVPETTQLWRLSAPPIAAPAETLPLAASGLREEGIARVAPPPALDPHTAQALPDFAETSAQSDFAVFPRGLQRAHLAPILSRSAASGLEFASLAMEVDGHLVTTGENFLTSHSSRHVEAADHYLLFQQALSDLMLDVPLTHDGVLRIYSFHTHPTRPPASSLVRSPNALHEDGRPYTLTNDADWRAYQGLFQAYVRELRAQGWRGPIEMVAGALPAGVEGANEALAREPYVAVTRLRAEAI